MRQRRSQASISHAASTGHLYPSVAVKPRTIPDYVGAPDGSGFHTAFAARQPIGLLSPHVEYECTKAILARNALRQAQPVQAQAPPAPADAEATQCLLPSEIMREISRPALRTFAIPPCNAAAVIQGASAGPSPDRIAAAGRMAIAESRQRVFLSSDPSFADRSVTAEDFGGHDQTHDAARSAAHQIKMAGAVRGRQGNLLRLGSYDADDLATIARRARHGSY